MMRRRTGNPLSSIVVRLCLVAVSFAFCGAPSAANAGGLKKYKAQKHKKRTGPRITDRNCPQQYTLRCQKACAAHDLPCRANCKNKAAAFCAKRKQKRHRATTKLVAKGASLGVGLAALALSSVPWNGCGPTIQGEGDFRIPWDRPSVIGMVGGGVITDDWSQIQSSNTYLATATMRLRLRFLGVSAMYSHLTEGSDTLDELDFGPTFYFANSVITFGIQPSILVSSGNDTRTLYGKGLRTWTRAYLGPLVGVLDTMLGKINGQWNYHGRIGAGLRLTPRLFAIVGVDFRDIVDLTDLDISTASLQGVMVGVGGRIN